MATELKQQDAPNWMDWVTNYDKTRELFLESWHALKSRRDWVAKNAPHLLAQHDAIMQKFRDQVPLIDNLKRIRDTVAGWLSSIGAFVQSALNFTGIAAASDWLKKQFGLSEYNPQTLGLAPVVWVAISIGTAVAGVATIASVVNEGFKHVTRIDAMKFAVEKGATPEQAARMVNDALGPNEQPQFLGLPLKELALAAVLLVLGPPIVKAVSERR